MLAAIGAAITLYYTHLRHVIDRASHDLDRDSNTIEVFIGRLRRKLDPDGTLNPIETLRGRGYRFALQRDGS